MNHSTRTILTIGIGALMLQGCAQTQAINREAPATVAQGAPLLPSGTDVPEVDGKPSVNADTKQKFALVEMTVKQQMQPGGRWQFVDKNERMMIDDSFADMDKLFGQFGSVDKMDDNAKVRLLADQSTVNAILTRKDGERLICTSEIPVGTHFPVKTCRTYSQIQIEQRSNQDSLWKFNATRQQMHCGLQQNGTTIAC